MSASIRIPENSHAACATPVMTQAYVNDCFAPIDLDTE